MRIDEMRGFFSRIAPGSAPAKSNAASSVLPVPLQQQQADDSLLLSKTGKILGLHVKTSPSLTGAQNTETDKLSKLPAWVQKADKTLLKTINIFERIQELATRAQDEKLEDIERVDMQIEIEDLRGNFMAMALPMRLDTESSPARLPLDPLFSQALGKEDYRYGDYSSVLGRMKTRIINGEEWDVKEAWFSSGFKRLVYEENGEEVVQAFAGEAWHVVGDEDKLTYGSQEHNIYADSGKNVPTVREKLEMRCPVVVMDAESAANGLKYLEDKIASLHEWRENLLTNFEDPSIGTAIAHFLFEVAFPGKVVNTDLLTDPTFVRFADNTLKLDVGNGEGIDSGISITDGQTIEDRSVLTNNGEILRIPKLTKESLESNLPEPKQPKVIEIKGISQKRK